MRSANTMNYYFEKKHNHRGSLHNQDWLKPIINHNFLLHLQSIDLNIYTEWDTERRHTPDII